MMLSSSSRLLFSLGTRAARQTLASSSSSLILSSKPSSNASFHTSPGTPTKALAIWEDLGQLKRSPAPALSLGLAGLIPFAAAPLYMGQAGVFMPEVATAQLAYGATILSFLGKTMTYVRTRTSVGQKNEIFKRKKKH